MEGLTEKDLAEFNEAFYGEAASKEFTINDLKQWSVELGLEVSQGVLQDLFRKFNSGTVDMAGLLKLLADHVPRPSTREDLETAFKAFDTDRSGKVSMDELRSMMKKLEHKPTKEEMEELMRAIDQDGDGSIDYHEFVQAMMS